MMKSATQPAPPAGANVLSVGWEPAMEELTAGEIMTRDVATVGPSATLREIAELLAARRISAAPVVDPHGRVVGMISETDLVDEEKRRVRLPRALLFGVFPILEEAVRAAYDEGEMLTAEDLMTRHVFTLP